MMSEAVPKQVTSTLVRLPCGGFRRIDGLLLLLSLSLIPDMMDYLPRSHQAPY